jgi:hypothetical protein
VSLGRSASLATTAWRLGIRNVASVALYRLRTRIGAVRARGEPVSPGDVFLPSADEAPAAPSDAPPDWFLNPFTGARFPHPEQPWHRLPDFDRAVGDIKCVWELSRLGWVPRLAQRYRSAADAAHLDRLNGWLRDWLEKNPPYLGPNWKCGQEASIRVLNLATAAFILEQVGTAPASLCDLIRLHLRRIEPTLGYGRAQDNNHGTSEAAALFVGGTWLAARGHGSGERWARRGRAMLEERVERLVAADGSFSQYSVNYHRLVLDTLAIAEVWRRQLDLPAFSERWRERAKAATYWLYAMTDGTTGDAPNLGANDGARLLQLADTAYRDYRPAVQLAMALFSDRRAYEGEGEWNRPLQWLGIELPPIAAALPQSAEFDDGGFAVLRRDQAKAVMRYPRFRFRPGHADALHVDLWQGGANLLRDGGSYSYADEAWHGYFSGTASHNTVQFDDRDQVPRLGRFLFGDWLETEAVEPLRQGRDSTTFAAGYRDRHGARHHRRIVLEDACLRVEDRVESFARKAVLRWRLMPGTWRIDGQSVTDGRHALSVSANVPMRRFALVSGWESRHYMEKTELPVLEAEIAEPGQLTTEYRWA